jgi:hypothetical protein
MDSLEEKVEELQYKLELEEEKYIVLLEVTLPTCRASRN